MENRVGSKADPHLGVTLKFRRTGPEDVAVAIERDLETGSI